MNEIYLTLKNLKGLDLLLYIIGMFWDVYFLSCGKNFLYCSFFSGVPVPKSLCEGDVVDIVFNRSTKWHIDLNQAIAEGIHPLLEKLKGQITVEITRLSWAVFFCKGSGGPPKWGRYAFRYRKLACMWAGGMNDGLDVNSKQWRLRRLHHQHRSPHISGCLERPMLRKSHADCHHSVAQFQSLPLPARTHLGQFYCT